MRVNFNSLSLFPEKHPYTHPSMSSYWCLCFSHNRYLGLVVTPKMRLLEFRANLSQAYGLKRRHMLGLHDGIYVQTRNPI